MSMVYSDAYKIGIMSPSFTNGSFSTGPDDKVAAVDVYDAEFAADGAAVINSVQDLGGGLIDTIKDLLNTSKLGISSFLEIKNDLAKFDPKKLTDRLMLSSGDFRASMSELSAGIKNNASLTLLKDKADAVMCTVNDYRSKVSGAQAQSVNQLGSFINSYTKTSIFKASDSGAVGSILGSVIGKASDLGITGAFTSLTATLKDNTILNKTVKALLPIALRNSDIKLLKEMSNSPAAKLINVISPGFSSAVAGYYKGTGAGKTGAISDWRDLTTTLSNVNSQWDKAQRGNGTTATNIVGLMGGSKDFQKLIVTGVSALNGGNPKAREKNYALASVYPKTSVADQFKKNFPAVVSLALSGSQKTRKAESVLGSAPLKILKKVLF